MIKHGDNSRTLAQALKISGPCFSAKLNGKRPFKTQELLFMAQRYKLSADDLLRIFD
jgi:hypothetical protein